MLSEINGYPLHYTILNTMMRSLLPCITKNEQWSKLIGSLSKVKSIYLIIENKLTKAKEGENKCPICQKFVFQGNLFVLIMHMEIQHECIPSKRYFLTAEYDNELVVKKYQLTYDGLEIHLMKRSSILDPSKKQGMKKLEKNYNSSGQVQFSFQDFITQNETTKFLQSNIKTRNMALLERIFSKFTKRIQKISTERKHYHSYNVYKTIGPDSQNSDDEHEQAIEKQLERLRINDFSDVSYWDKMLYLEWNDLLRKEKKELKIIDNVLAVAEKFIEICKKKGIPKININMHMYTLWSVGKIISTDMLELSMRYEKCEVNKPNVQTIQKTEMEKIQMEKE